MEEQIHLNKFKLRPYQLPFWKALFLEKKQRLMCVWARRSGKDLVCFNALLLKALERVGVYYLIYPTYFQGRRILWDSMTIDGQRFLDYIPASLIEAIILPR